MFSQKKKNVNESRAKEKAQDLKGRLSWIIYKSPSNWSQGMMMKKIMNCLLCMWWGAEMIWTCCWRPEACWLSKLNERRMKASTRLIPLVIIGRLLQECWATSTSCFAENMNYVNATDPLLFQHLKLAIRRVIFSTWWVLKKSARLGEQIWNPYSLPGRVAKRW